MSKLFKKADEYRLEKVNFHIEETVLNSTKKFLIIERFSKKEKQIKYNKFKYFIKNDLEEMIENSVLRIDNKNFDFTDNEKKKLLLHLLKIGLKYNEENDIDSDDSDDFEF
jgi:hypothetical protein